MAQTIPGTTFSPMFYKMTARFDPTAPLPITFPNGDSIEVTAYLGVILLELVPVNAPGASFATAPLQRVVNGKAEPLPEAFLLQDQTPTQVTILDVNPGLQTETFDVLVLVEYNGKFYSSLDPTIINAEIPGTVNSQIVKAKRAAQALRPVG
jgi:hypothetical protein